MSTSIPYDPDDFDNNPFAEPVHQPVLAEHYPQHKQPQATQRQITDHNDTLYHSPSEPLNSEGTNEYMNHTQNTEHSNEDGSQTNNTTATATSSKISDEDIELLPERFDGRQSEYRITVKVTGLERYGSFANKRENPNIVFDLHTNIKTFKSKSYKCVRKSYTEFQTFFKLLNESIPEVFVESLPPPMTNYGISNEKDYFKTVKLFQGWLNSIVRNPILQRLPELQYFVESDHNSYKPISKLNQTATGLKRKTLKQLAPPYDECLELAEFRPLIKSLHRNCKTVHETLEKVVRLKKNFGSAEIDMGVTIGELKPLEVGHAGMAKLWESFGKTISLVGDFDTILGSLELASFGDGISKLIQDTYIIKESLTDRHLLMRELINAQQHTKAKHEGAAKLRTKRDINPIKVNDAIESLNEAIKEETELTKRIQRVTKEMLIEKAHIMEKLDIQIKDVFKELLISKIEYERKKLMSLEKIKISVRSVDSNGGLSRLGRENYPKTDLSKSVKPSQSINGDSWSGAKRTYDHKELTSKVEAFENLHYSNGDGVSAQEDEEERQYSEDDDEQDDSQVTARNAASLLGSTSF